MKVKPLVLQVVQEEVSQQLPNLPGGVTFDQVTEKSWRKMVASALIELIDEGKIRCEHGSMYFPVAP